MRVSKRWFFVSLLFLSTFVSAVVLVGCGPEITDGYGIVEPPLARRPPSGPRQYSKFTMAQRMAGLHELEAKRHPQWRDPSFNAMVRRLLKLFTGSAATSSSQPPLAPFLGNTTVIASPSGTLVGLMRQSNCTLTMGWASYSLSQLPSISYDIPTPTANYNQVLHNEAGLTTTGGVWPNGCVDSDLGVASGMVVPLGMSSANQLVGAAVAYDSANSAEVLLTFDGGLTGSNTVSIGGGSVPNSSVIALAGGDLNGDGIPDLVLVNTATSTGGSASLAVILGTASGSFQPATNYTLPGGIGISAVIDDFNGDGKPDIVVSSSSFSSGTTTYSLTFFAGKGDGTFQTPQSVTVTPPAGISGRAPYFGLTSADLLGNGKKDLVTSAGIVLLGNGDGTFDQSAALAFPTPLSTPQGSPNVVAADFNKDGKLDLAVDDGASISIYLGDGTGAFTAAGSYATINNTGVLSAADLDGDGNVDLYSGTARAGYFGGDPLSYNQAYALMGNGNGTFQGAPEIPFVLTGTNLAKLTSSSNLDGVGVTADSSTSTVSMVSYLGNGSGAFTAGPTLQVSPVTIQGRTYSFGSLDSYGLGDITGNGHVDLAYLAQAGSDYAPKVGYFIATGNGDGSFNAPTFVAAPLFAPSGDVDEGETLTNLFVADVNGDGKADLIYSYSTEVFTTGVNEQGIAIQLSNGDGTFQAPQVIQTYSSTTAPPGAPPQVVYIGDATGSGKLDLITMTTTLSIVNGTGVTTYNLQLYLGNGDGTFGSALTPPVADNVNPPFGGTVTGQIALADMNGDGRPDLITLGTTNNGNYAELAIALGNGDGTFQTPTVVDFGDGSSLGYGIAVADFNGDGKPDVAVTGSDPSLDSGIFLGNGDGTVQTSTTGSGGLAPSESIGLLVDGTAQAVNLSGGTGLPDLIAGGAVLINQASTTPTLTPTTTTLTASATSITIGQSVTFTATVSASGSTPSGSVTFSDGSTVLGTGTLNGSDVATYTTSSLGVGAHSITASYAGNSTFATSASSATTVTVTTSALTATTTALTASATSITTGQSVTFTATVSASGSTPSGSVTFSDGSTVLGTGTLNGSGVATYTTSSLGVGAHSITASYAGNSTFATSASSATTITITAPALTATTTALTASATSITTGQSVTFTATVSASGSTPSGSVTFSDGSTVLGTGTLNGSGVATYTTSSLGVGAHSITASYAGNSTFAASVSSATTITITAPALTATTTALTASATSITTGQSVTFTATVSASGSTPSGSVTFSDGSTVVGMGTLNGSGVATYITSSLSLGTHSISVSYAGNSTFASSASSATVVIVTAPALTASTATLTASATAVTPGANVTFNVVVAPASGTGTPTGTVSFMNGTTALAAISLSNGAASYSTTSLPVGADSISAVYSGDTNFSGSTSSTVTVNVQALVPSFTLGASPTSGTVTAGATAQTTITVTPVNGFNSPVSFACSGLPTGATCSFSPSSVTPSGSAVTTAMSIATTAQSAALTPSRGPASRSGLRGGATLAFLAGGGLWLFRRRKNLRWPLALPTMIALLAFATLLSGCVGSKSKVATITVTATAGSETQTATYTLTVKK